MNSFPGNKKFAFTVFDDTDESTVENTEPVYQFLSECGFRVTKSVWPLANVSGAMIGGGTLQDPGYLKFVLGLRAQGHEIALHGVRNYDSTRDVVEQGIGEFNRLLGELPHIHANHHKNRDNIYWGGDRLSGNVRRFTYGVASFLAGASRFEGHKQHSSYFWGDLCREHIRYVRNFVFDEVNLERINPTLPYYDDSKTFVNAWFSSSEGGTVESFCRTLSEQNQDRLEAEHGVCIMYTHFARGFCRDGVLSPQFAMLMRRIAKKYGWFVPVSELLGYLHHRRGHCRIPTHELAAMERRWLLHKLRVGRS